MLDSFKQKWNDFLENHPHIETGVNWIKDISPPLNYITIHYAYFIIVILVSSVIFWGSSNPFQSVSYLDSLFFATSAITTTGLNPVNISSLTTWQQIILATLFVVGSPIWISFWTLIIRKHAFERRFEDIVDKEREKRKREASILGRAPNLINMLSFSKRLTTDGTSGGALSGLGSRIRSGQEPNSGDAESDDLESNAKNPQDAPEPSGRISPVQEEDTASDSRTEISEPIHNTPEVTRDHIAIVEPTSPRHPEGHSSAYRLNDRLAPPSARRQSIATASQTSGSDDDFVSMHWNKILGKHNVSRKGQFFDLSSDEREHLGGCEYRALKLLSIAIPVYSACWQVFGAIALGCWVGSRHPGPATDNQMNPYWTGIFFAVSAFNNIGMSLTDASVVPFHSDYFVQILVALLVLVGNTAYPVLLRFFLWSCLQILNRVTEPEACAELKETFEFILKYPRRVYTTLFPARATWWLVLVLFITNITDWVAFEVLNIGNPAVHILSLGDQIMNGLFQGIVVRAAGFTVISLTSLYIGVQVLYLVMMYIAAYPVIITMRSSNVYEERSLGIYEDDPSVKERGEPTTLLADANDEEKISLRLRRRTTAAVIGKQLKKATTFQGVGVSTAPKAEEDPNPISFVGQQIRGQLAHDLWWLVGAVFIIVIIETHHFLTDPTTYSVFNILFEATSAYACVGLSPGLPDQSYSLSGGLYKGSRFVLILVMLRGRHRGLPVAIDRAVRLPGEHLHKEEEEDSRIRRTKTINRMMSRETEP